MPTQPVPNRSRAAGRSATYHAYLASRAWKEQRRTWHAAWLTPNGTPPTCLVCGRVWTLKTGHLHHLTYHRIGAEQDTDLLPLCAAHHASLHELLPKSSLRRLGRAAASLRIIARLAAHQPSRDTAAPRPSSQDTTAEFRAQGAKTVSDASGRDDVAELASIGAALGLSARSMR